MTDPSTDPAELQSALREIESELERLREEDEQIGRDLDPSQGPTDAGDVAALTNARQENEALRDTLEARRARLQEQLNPR